MATLFGLFAFLRKLYADGGYQGPAFRKALARVLRQVDVEIVKRSDRAQGFEVLPRRWIVERTIGWLNRCRRSGSRKKFAKSAPSVLSRERRNQALRITSREDGAILQQALRVCPGTS